MSGVAGCDTRVRIELRPGKWALVTPAMAAALRPPAMDVRAFVPEPKHKLLVELQRLADARLSLPSDITLRRAIGVAQTANVTALLDALQDDGALRHDVIGHRILVLRVIHLDWCGSVLRSAGVADGVMP
jgi:hypothetical protein